MKTGSLIAGTLIGLTAGALLGIMFAPKKGEVTRRFVAQKGNVYIGEIKELLSESLDDVNHKIDGLKDEVKNMIKKGLTKTEEEYNKSTI